VTSVPGSREPRSRFTGSNQDKAANRRIGKPSMQAPVRDPIDEANKDSFPASDPSSSWAGHDVLGQSGTTGERAGS
jgi:hypothetical protein